MATQISQKWKKVKLSDLGSVERGRSRHRPRNDASLYGGEYPFIQTGDIKSANFYIDSYSQTYSEKGLSQSKLWNPDTLCITIAANIGESAILKMSACFPDSVVGFQSYENVSDVRYVKYLLDLIKNQFQAISQGTTQDNLSLEKLLSINLDVPDYLTQKQIADVISVYDSLISNGYNRIKILEELTQRIYTEWFVNFRFPNHKKEKFSPDGLPDGWIVEEIGNKVKILKGKNITRDTVESGPIPVVAGGLEPAYYHNKSNVTGPVITISASGANSGFINLYYEDIWASDCSYINSKVTKYVFFFYTLLKVKQAEVTHLQRGSAQPHVYPKDIMGIKSLFPKDNSVIDDFERTVTPLYFMIENLKKQIKSFKQSRDFLIPQLLTGKLEINT